MRSSFLVKLVNGPLFDPVLYLRLINENRAIIFDCGRFYELSNSEMLIIDAVFISHMHMDHFMGFDSLLRVILHRDRPLDVFGPEGIISKVRAKLQSYTWNLTKEYPLVITAHEVRGDTVQTASFAASSGFSMAGEKEAARLGEEIYSCPRFCVDAAILDHNIPCLSFVLKERFHVNIRSDAMAARGYVPGPWVGRLKEMALADKTGPIDVDTGHGIVKVGSDELLRDIAVVTKGQKIAYMTDARFSEENVARFVEIAKGADMLFIETFYRDEMRGEALAKGHLTDGQALEICKKAGALKMVPMHISPRYHERLGDLISDP